ncbi:MAG: Fe-S protein assembly chaperone HscA [Bacteroidetes bacterium]|nr:Fe-S protein assembly chaperone HscA [Bacteroidota bacterium]
MKIPINIVTGQLKEEEIIVGIDLGTTNSLVAYINKNGGNPTTIADSTGEVIVPSVIYFDQNNQPIVGVEAHQHLIDSPENTIYSVKRLLGKSYKDIEQTQSHYSYRIIDDKTEGLVKIACGGIYYSPIELSAMILKELKERASHFLRTDIKKAVITVPAYFNDSQRQATRDAGKLAGLDVLRIINEPTAASLAYGIGVQADDHQTIAVYDLGGGTFDISILNIENGIFEVLSTNGDTFLGGDDFDRAIVDYWQHIYQFSATDNRQKQQVRLAAEQAKKILTTAKEYSQEVVLGADTYTFTLTLDQLIQIITPIVSKTMDCCKLAVADAKLDISAIKHVVLVGGSTRTPYVKEQVASFFNAAVVHDQINPDEVVALGASIQADILAGNRRDLLLLDVTPLSLGIETLGGLMDTIIPRNTKVPAGAGREYSTSVDGQTNIKLSVYQGERDMVSENRKLGEFILKGIPAMPAGFPKIEIKFQLNADGILKVSATELRSDVKQEVEVKPQYGLTDAEIEKMLLDSFTNAQADVNTRLLVESKTEAQMLVYTTEKFLRNHRDQLNDEEFANTQASIDELKSSMAGDDRQLILQHTEKLNEVTKPFAERLMDIAIAEAMKGKKL